jgi:6-phosphogluconolactonase
MNRKQNFFIRSLLCGVLSLSKHLSQAAETTMIYGSSASGKKVAVVVVEEKDGEATLKQVQSAEIDHRGRAIAYQKSKRRLYVIPNPSKPEVNTDGTLFTVGSDGLLKDKKTIQFPNGGDYLTFDRSERFLLSASFFEGIVNVHSLNAEGGIEKVVSSVNNNLLYSHAVLTSPDDKFAYIPYVRKSNGLYQYSYNAETGQLSALNPVQAKVPDGVAPRHLVFHPHKPFVFFSNEQELGVSSYSMDDNGQLKLVQISSALNIEPEKGLAASDIVITSNGKFLFHGVRGFGKELNAVFRYEVHPNGTLKCLGKTDTDSIPWALGLDSGSRHLFVSATKSGTLTAYKIDPSGDLHKQGSLEWGKDFQDFIVVGD